MAEKLQVVRDAAPGAAADETALLRKTLLREIVAQIRRDCVSQCQSYLDETNVPHGGE